MDAIQIFDLEWKYRESISKEKKSSLYHLDSQIFTMNFHVSELFPILKVLEEGYI